MQNPADVPAFGIANAQLVELYLNVAAGADGAVAVSALHAIADGVPSADWPLVGPLLDRFADLIALNLPPDDAEGFRADIAVLHPADAGQVPVPPAFPGQDATLAGLGPDGVPGISLVTCCMNRSDNLLLALPSWLAHPVIAEVVIVDWSSTVPVAEVLATAGIADPRIRIVRVEGEPRWVLSWAFNAGFRAASCATILKADADIVISADFFRRNVLPQDGFVAGSWRAATSDQAHVNGFFYAPRRLLAAVGGFNEYITTYGWDDDDLYARLLAEGFRRVNVAADTVHHLPHDDAARTGDAGAAGDASAAAELQSGTTFLIRRNRYIANVMPPWRPDLPATGYEVLARGDDRLTLARAARPRSVVPAHVQEAARVHALTEMASWHLGPRVREVDPDRLMALLSRPLADLHRLDVEVSLSNRPEVALQPGRYLALSVAAPVLQSIDVRGIGVLRRILDNARAAGLKPVVIAPDAPLPDLLRDLPRVAPGPHLGKLRRVAPRLAVEARASDVTDNMQVELTEDALDRLHKLGTARSPAVQVPQPKLFIDAQHGLGNRLRAIASAMSIAKGLGREPVIVWEPDIHCDCHLADLLEYEGAVIRQRFLQDAADRGCAVFNYMPHEPGAAKDAPIRARPRDDIYARSAFVLRSPHSTWDADNANLRSLRPVQAVRDLVARVPQPFALSAHVRMEAGKGRDHNAWDRPENWRPEDHDLIHHWRAKSHFSRFMARIDALLARPGSGRLFVAADLPETYAAFAERYGDRLLHLPRDVYDRSAGQIRHALADAMLLGMAPRMLGSTWSSFSELAQRLAPGPMVTEMSGKDF